MPPRRTGTWALEGFTEGLAQEVAPFGIRTTLIEPSAFATDWAGASATRSAPNPIYQPLRDCVAANFTGPFPTPEDSVNAVFEPIDAAEPPTRLILGSDGYDHLLATRQQRVATREAWEKTTRSADPQEQRARARRGSRRRPPIDGVRGSG